MICTKDLRALTKTCYQMHSFSVIKVSLAKNVKDDFKNWLQEVQLPLLEATDYIKRSYCHSDAKAYYRKLKQISPHNVITRKKLSLSIKAYFQYLIKDTNPSERLILETLWNDIRTTRERFFKAKEDLWFFANRYKEVC